MTSFLAELKRRNVVRVAILYAVVGWLVLQIADLAMPALGIPPWGLSLAVVLVVLGFPIALVLAWAFELTPDGIKRTHEVEHHESVTHLTGRKIDFLIIGVLAAALLFVVYDAYAPRLRTAVSGASRAPATGLQLTSIAVLPFVDMSQAKDQEYLTDGISEELLNVLARAEGFKVAGRTSSFSFKGRDDDLRAIGEKLGVEHIVEGSVRKQGDRIRVTAQLVKAADGYHLWSATYDRRLDDVFAIQDEIAQQVVGAVRRTLGKTSLEPASSLAGEKRPTDNVEAYTHYLRGQHLLRPRTREGMEAALAEFEKAIALDPDFARAHVGIANSLVLLAGYGRRGIAEVEVQAASELERALALEPDLGEAYAGKALLLGEQRKPVSVQVPLLERAVAANPSDSQSLMWLGHVYGQAGRAEDEMHAYERAYAVDPLAPILLTNYAAASQRRGQRDRAQRLVNELAAVQPDSTSLFVTRCILARHDGRADLALRWAAAAAKLDPNDAGTQELLAFLYAWLGDVDTGLRHAARLKELSPGSSWGLVWQIYLQVQAGNLTAAEGQVKTGAAGFKESPSFLQAKAHFHTAKGQYAEALDALVKAMPSFREAALEVEGELQFIEFPHALFLYRQAGNEAQARGIAAAFTRTADGYYKPLEGLERGLSLSVRAEMAAVNGDRARLIANLTQLYDTGGILPAFVLNEPWFRPYRGDPNVAELLAKHDARRGEARRQLAADGL